MNPHRLSVERLGGGIKRHNAFPAFDATIVVSQADFHKDDSSQFLRQILVAIRTRNAVVREPLIDQVMQ